MTSNIQIQIESPVKYYDFIDQHGVALATLKFIPTDLDIFDKYKEVLASFEELLEKTKSINAENDKSVLEIKKEATELFKEKIDYLFNADTSELFSVAGPLTLMNNDVWGGVVLKKVLEIIEDATGKSLSEMNKSPKNDHLKKYPAGKTTRKK